jgi:hypothetical protein
MGSNPIGLTIPLARGTTAIIRNGDRQPSPRPIDAETPTAARSCRKETSMRRALRVLILALAPVMMPGGVGAAGPYDGQWAGTARSTGNTPGHFCPTEGPVTLTIEDGDVSGQIIFSAGAPVIHGRVVANGAVTGTAGTAALAGKFSQGMFEGSYTNPSGCQVSLRLVRAK